MIMDESLLASGAAMYAMPGYGGELVYFPTTIAVSAAPPVPGEMIGDAMAGPAPVPAAAHAQADEQADVGAGKSASGTM